MKNVVAITFLVVLVVSSCKNEPAHNGMDATTTVTPVDSIFTELDTADMQTISLLDYNLNLRIKVPIIATAAGAIIEPRIEHVDGDYLWFIRIGSYFNLVIEDYAKEFGKVTKHIKDLAEQKDVFEVDFIEKTPNLLFYKRTLIEDNGGLPSFHCYAELEIDGYNYVLRTEAFGGYEPVVRDLVTAVKTAKSITK